MERSFMDSWAVIFLIVASIAVLVIMEKMGISFENSKTETVKMINQSIHSVSW